MRSLIVSFAAILVFSTAMGIAAEHDAKPVGDHTAADEVKPTVTEIEPNSTASTIPPAIALPLPPKLATAVVVTQCQQIVVVYVTAFDGRLFRFDSKSNVSTNDMQAIAQSALRSERVEVACSESTALPLGAR